MVVAVLIMPASGVALRNTSHISTTDRIAGVEMGSVDFLDRQLRMGNQKANKEVLSLGKYEHPPGST
jgi:hypothetical protein